jgi:flagellar biosynthesis chaperone FliJ
VTEERTVGEQVQLVSSNDDQIRFFLAQPVVGAKVKEGLKQALELRQALSKTQRDIGDQQTQLKTITDDQVRLRANLKEMPPTAAAYKRYLEKFDAQETQIEQLQEQVKKLQATESQQKKEFDDFLANFSAE